MITRSVSVIQTGTANLASVLAGLRRLGAQPRLDNDPDTIARAERVVLPGVGALAPAIRRLEGDGLREALGIRFAENRPTLAICLGLQLLCRGSQESPDTPGLGFLDLVASRFPDTVPVPQMGWNHLEPDQRCRYLRPGYAYFANSYRLTEAPADWRVAWAWHGTPFVAALEHGALLACQFHPELSGAWGQDLLRRWLEDETAGGVSC
ncbi:MAG: imidazole glycerol phosphate synthase subunit HisH [bacterium]